MFTARAPLSLLAVAATLAFAGCGGSDEASGDSGSSDTLPRAELATKADAICETAKQDSLKVTQPTDFATDPAAAAGYLSKIQVITRTEQTDLAALKPDADAKADYDAMVAAQGKLAGLLDGVVTKAKAKDASGLQDLAKGADLSKPFIAAATKIGAKGCAAG